MNLTKKITAAVVFVAVFILNVGCSTLKNIGASIFGGVAAFFISDGNVESGKNSSRTEIKEPSYSPSAKNQLASQITSRNYKTPDSYDEAYSWRTGKAAQKMTQLKNNKSIDSIRKSNAMDYITRVVQEINASVKSDFEKAKMAHDITALVLKYDAANYWKGSVPPQDFISVLQSGTAVCEGYSNVFKKICDELKLPCQIVHGYARGVGTTLFDETDVTDSNHAWNIVQINNAWYLVDCTWDSGFMQGRSSKQEYTTNWLFTKPEHFIYTHLPERQNQQLLTSPISSAQFSALPELRPNFFDAVTDLKTDLPKVVACDGKFELEFDLKDGCEISFDVESMVSKARVSNCNFVKADGTHATVMFSFAKEGTYDVKMFYKSAGMKTGKGCGEFFVQSTNASAVRYPTIFANYGKDAVIVTPIEMPLKRGVVQNFHITSPKKFVFVIIGNSRTPLKGDGTGNFYGEVKIPQNAKQISVAVADREKGNSSIVATYSVF